MALKLVVFALLVGPTLTERLETNPHNRLNLLCTSLSTSPLAHRFEQKKTFSSRSIASHCLSEPDPLNLYPEYNLSVPIDHFHNDSMYEPHSDGFFNLRYWFDASNYRPGGPVIVLQSGETSGVDRLPFLQKGILAQLAQATHGIGVVLEHRYYGKSFPTPDLSTENLRFLTTDQALADEVYFAQHVVFAGLEDRNLTAPNVAYIGYGGSYAGALNAFLRKLYPDVFWGAISSSGVTVAVYDYWQYYDPIREYGPPECIKTQQKLTNVVDNILTGEKKDDKTIQRLKTAFGMGNVTHDSDFASVLASGIDNWQERNWDPAVNDPSFEYYCRNITSNSVLYPETRRLKREVKKLIILGGYKREARTLTTRMLNYIGYLNLTAVSHCTSSQDSCFSTYEPDFYRLDDITQTWRSWPYQYCTQWGYLQTGSGVPKDQLPLVSRTLDIEHCSLVCREAFNISTAPDVEAINKYGGYALSYPRLAFIDGEQDPWRPATPHASPFVAGVKNRTSSSEEPFILIAGAVHHWDENGLFENETTPNLPPKAVAGSQQAEIRFVREWMEDWYSEKGMRGEKLSVDSELGVEL